MKTEKVSGVKKELPCPVIDIEITNVVLTPFTCASLVNEILKGLLHQKNQIPYSYNWLKSIVTKKRAQDSNGEKTGPANFKLVNHFRIVSNAYDTLESLMKAIIKEFSESLETIRKVVIVFGTTPECPKEVISINTTSIMQGHHERNHKEQLVKYQQRILRRIFLSQDWIDNIDNSLSCTNTYVFLKKYCPLNSERTTSDQDVFKPVRPLTFSKKVKHIEINFSADEFADTNCCDNLLVFSDDGKHNKVSADVSRDIHTDDNIVWYKSKDSFQGFKDCYINKTSASELW